MGLVNHLKQQVRDKDDFKEKEKGAYHEESNSHREYIESD